MRQYRDMELKIPPIAAFAALMVAVTSMLPGLIWLVPGRLVIAVGMALIGGAISLFGVVAFRRHHTTVNPMAPATATTIVSTGPYRFTRNPMYVGFILGLTGWAVFLSNIGSFLLVLGCALYLAQFQIKPEERELSKQFGKPFADYMASVRRWL